MPDRDPSGRRGRRGRRSPAMIRIAGERIRELFALAEVESRRPGSAFPDRYVELARRVGTRYNVRFPPEFAELYCRGCSTFWVEGRTVRTRLRAGRRIRTCLRCGRRRRVLRAARAPLPGAPPSGALRPEPPEAVALVEEGDEDAPEEFGEDDVD